MPDPKTGNGNGIAKWLGLSVDKWVSIFQTVGVPTLLLAFIMYGIWTYIPGVVDGHLQLLRQTGETLNKMDDTLDQSNGVLSEIADIQRETKVFMQNVEKCHVIHEQKLDTVIEQTKKP